MAGGNIQTGMRDELSIFIAASTDGSIDGSTDTDKQTEQQEDKKHE